MEIIEILKFIAMFLGAVVLAPLAIVVVGSVLGLGVLFATAVFVTALEWMDRK